MRHLAERIEYFANLTYRCFAGRDDILLAPVQDGSARLRAAVAGAARPVRTEPAAVRAAVYRAVRAHLGFTLEEAETYQLRYGLGGVRVEAGDACVEGQAVGEALTEPLSAAGSPTPTPRCCSSGRPPPASSPCARSVAPSCRPPRSPPSSTPPFVDVLIRVVPLTRPFRKRPDMVFDAPVRDIADLLAPPGSPAHRRATSPRNTLGTQDPAAVARVADPGDVATWLRWAAEQDLTVQIRGRPRATGERAVAGRYGSKDPEQRAEVLLRRGVRRDIAELLDTGQDPTMGRAVLALYRSATQPAMAELGRDLERAAARPGLAVIAAEDLVVGTDGQRRRSAARAGARTKVLDGLRHWWMLEDPARGAETLDTFWTSITPTGRAVHPR